MGLAERLGLIPDYPAKLRELAGDRASFGAALLEYIRANPKATPWLPYILAKTLGEELGSKNLAALWGLLARFPVMHAAGRGSCRVIRWGLLPAKKYSKRF